jgi:hypothetical protein
MGTWLLSETLRRTHPIAHDVAVRWVVLGTIREGVPPSVDAALRR